MHMNAAFFEASTTNDWNVAGHAHNLQTSGLPVTQRDGDHWELSLSYKEGVGELPSPVHFISSETLTVTGCSSCHISAAMCGTSVVA